MAQGRGLAALLGDQGPIPSILSSVVHAPKNLIDVLFWLSWVPGTHMAHGVTDNTHTHTLKSKTKRNNI